MKGTLTLKPKKALSEGEYLTGYNTQVMVGDKELHGVEAVDIIYRPNEVVRAVVRLFSVEDEMAGSKPSVRMIHPETGKLCEITEIKFLNGSVVNFGE